MTCLCEVSYCCAPIGQSCVPRVYLYSLLHALPTVKEANTSSVLMSQQVDSLVLRHYKIDTIMMVMTMVMIITTTTAVRTAMTILMAKMGISRGYTTG